MIRNFISLIIFAVLFFLFGSTFIISYQILKDKVIITIKTDCDETTSKLWNNYFNKNNFELSLQKEVKDV